MKLKFYPCTIVLVTVILFHTQPSHGQQRFTSGNSLLQPGNAHIAPDAVAIDQNWQKEATRHIQNIEYGFYQATTGGSYKAVNSATHTGYVFQPTSYSVNRVLLDPKDKPWEARFTLSGIGRQEDIVWAPGKDFTVIKEEGVLRYNYPVADIEYNNTTDGLRQNFIIKERLSGTAPFLIHIQLETSLYPAMMSSGQLALYATADKTGLALTYEDLKVWDANHDPVPAAMKLKGNELLIEVDDRKAVYPITVDPINKTPEWNTTVDGLLTGLLNNTQMKAALYGYAVSGLGDVNNDGFGDVAVTAPTMIDVFTNNTLASVGAVFVFYGSAAGLSTTPNKILQPNTAIAGALFGMSIDAGDVTGDGINDIIVGAPLDRFQVTLGGSGVTVNAGKIYVFKGGSLTGSNPAPLLEVKLNNTFFTQGLVGILANTGVNALFGFSLAVTDDLNGDNKKDIIVGAPAYLGTSLGAVQSGSAFVFLSDPDPLKDTFPVIRSLQPPTYSLLGINLPLLSGINGLLFGYSVDGIGDYNGDGRPDVVVGAPAGVNLSSLTNIVNGQVLGGSAFVYFGANTVANGVNTTSTTKLQAASGSLLGNAANLFGFKVKGARNVNGTHNGNILVGAPMGGLLTNALGLSVKAGNVHLFRQKTSPGATETTNEKLESPKASNLLQVLNTLNLNALFGASLDNAYDVNNDGAADLIVGEPLSSGTNILQLQANAVGGSAYVFYGDGSGGYLTTNVYDVSSTYGTDLASVNATALLGYSVAGAPNIKGPGTQSKVVIGAPSGALDFGGLLNLGNTLGTVLNFAAGNNGLGKAYTFDAQFVSLPVTITSLRTKQHDGVVDVEWRVENETDINVYELQRSGDGVHYATISLVFPWDNDAVSKQYLYTDKKPLTGINYYRLKIVDKDTRFKYSYIVAAKINANNNDKIVVAPNPTTGNIRIFFSGIEEGSYRLELRNTVGQLTGSKMIRISQEQQIEFVDRNSAMTPGTYWINVYDGKNQQVHVSRVIIQ